jgi:hypothetical protein
MVAKGIETIGLDRVEKGLKAAQPKEVLSDSLRDISQEKYIPLLLQQIIQDGLVGTGEDDGPGPSISSRKAWDIDRRGQLLYNIKPIDIVAPRVKYLEYGTGIITPKTGEFLKFENEQGEEVFVRSVDGVRPHHFMRSSVDRLEQSKQINRTVADDIEDYFDALLG